MGILLLAGQYEEVVTESQQILKMQPDNPMVLYITAFAAMLQGDWSDLTKYLATTRETAERVDVWLALAEGDREEAERLMEHYGEKLQTANQFLQLIEQLHVTKGRIGLPSMSEALMTLQGQGSNLAERMSQMLREMSPAMLKQVQQSPLFQGLASSLGMADDEAKGTIGQWLSVDQTILAAVMNAQSLLMVKRYDEALSELNRVIEIQPDYVPALVLRGSIYQKIQRYEEALGDFDHAVALDKAAAKQVANQRGLLLSYCGRYGEAVESYKHVLEEKPNDHVALYNIAVVLARWKGFAEAQTQIDAAHTLLSAMLGTDERYTALYGLGGLEAVTGHTEEALNYLRQAIVLNKIASEWARHDVAWLELRGDARFQSLISG